MYRLTEFRPGEQYVSFVTSSSLIIYRTEPGWYDYRVEACMRGTDGYPVCGNSSPKLRLTVTDQAVPKPNKFTAPETATLAVATIGGPDQLRPGGWVSADKDAQGWYFYWANRLALPETDPLFANSYDLVGIWYTFEAKSVYFDDEVCNCNLYDDYLPVTAQLKLVQLDATTFSGGLWITRNGVAAQVGGANVNFGPDNTQATINWWANFKNELIPATSDTVTNLVSSDPASTDNISHYSGQWNPASGGNYFVDDLITDWIEVVNVTFEDDAGDPAWVQATSSTLLESNVNFCLRYLHSGYRPDQAASSGVIYNYWTDSGCDGTQSGSGTNRNGRRYFSGFDTGRFWATYTLPGTPYATGSVTIGSASSPAVMDKSSNFHRIFFSGANSCQISTQSPSCNVDLTWFSDSDYPSASAFAYNTTTGARSLVKVSTTPAEVGFTHPLGVAGNYVFELRMGKGVSDTLIASSPGFTVTEISGPPVAPTGLNVIWTDEPNRNYLVQWGHSNPGAVVNYDLEETLPGSSVVNHSVAPGTTLQKAFSRPAGPFGQYSYRVRACNAVGCSSYSAVVPWTITQPPLQSEEHPWGDNAYGSLDTNYGYHYAMGYHFKPAVNGQVVQLGGFFKGTKIIRLFQRGEPELGELASAVVNANNSWSYAPISAVHIAAGIEYTVAVYLAGSGGSDRSGVGLPDTYGSIEILGSTYASTSDNPNAIPTNIVYSKMYGQADIGFVPDPINLPPTINNPGAQANKNGDAVSILTGATDPEGNNLFFGIAGQPANLTIDNSTGLISGAVNDIVGNYAVIVGVNDGNGGSDSANFNWTILNTNPQVAPPGNQTDNEGDPVSLAIASSDVDPGDTRTFSASGLPTGLTINSASGIISGTIAVGAGVMSPFSVTVTATDNHGGSGNSGTFFWTIAGNSPPNVTNPGNQINKNGDEIALLIVANDPDIGNTLSYSATGLPANLSINSGSGLISGTQGDTVGNYAVNITVGDGNGGSASAPFTWTIQNSNPVVTSPGNQSHGEGVAVSLPVSAADIDPGDILSYSATGLPTGLSIASSTGLISGTIATGAQAGSPFSVSVSATDSGGLSDVVAFQWTVNPPTPANPETPHPPAGPPDMTPTVTSSKVGATAGQFRVDESGSAIYSIPIITAPGSGGVAPQVSLDYSSQSGNGPLGVGWGLGGASSITRCSRTIEQDGVTGSVNLDANDRFCLDGQRLLLVSGTYGGNGAEYRTEIDSISRIRSFSSVGSGPAWFTVERKDGSTTEYGNTTDSQINAGSEILVWAQNRYEDSAGNYILYRYAVTSSPIEFVISQIEYTGNGTQSPYAKLDFIWTGGRSDSTSTFIAGHELQLSKTLSRIDSLAKKDALSAYTSLRSYFLSYADDGVGRRSLQSVEECNNSAKQVCFSPTGFTWLNSMHDIGTTIAHDNVLATNQVLYGLQVADVNGDGRPDILYTKKTGKNYRLQIESPNASGVFSSWGGNYTLPQKEDDTPPRVFGIDLNADGYQDLIYRKHVGNGNYQWAGLMSTGAGFAAETILSATIFTVNEYSTGIESRVSVVDFNGDGLSDVMYNKTSALGDEHDIEVAINTWSPGGSLGLAAPIEISSNFGNLFPSPVGDGNGDLWETFDKANFGDWNSTQLQGRNTPDARVFDYNGDGAVDILINVWREYRNCISDCFIQPIAAPSGEVTALANPVYQFKVVSFWILMESTGNNSYTEKIIGIGSSCTLPDPCDSTPGLPATDLMWPLDINADGLADIAYTDNGGGGGKGWHYSLNNGSGFGTTRDITAFPSPIPIGAEDSVRFEDMNGDGYPDLIYPGAEQSQSTTWKVIYNQFGLSFGNPVTTAIKAGNVGGDPASQNIENDASIFADFSGDGKLDQFYINFSTQGKPTDSDLFLGRNKYNNSSVHAASNVITHITNGIGSVTTISYKPLTEPLVYTRMNDASNADWGAGSVVYDLIAPIYVVSQVSSSSPTFSSSNATSSVEYHYAGAKMQGGGRGFLGFGEVISYDPQNLIRTNTRYRQDFPFTGLLADTTQSIVSSGQKFELVSNTSANSPVNWGSVTATTVAASPSGTRISYAINEWGTLTTSGGAVFPYVADSLERSYTLDGAFNRKVLTSNVYADNGNLSSASVKTYATDGSTVFASQTTANTYSDNLTNWHLGRLVTSSVTHSRSGEPSIARHSSYSYNPTTGILDQEVIEPNNNIFKVITDFTLDNFGNRTRTTVTGFGMTPRVAEADFDTLGRFVVETRNDLNQVTQRINDWDAYGNALETENIDGVLTFAATDFMGRAFISYTETGGFSKTTHSTSTISCPSGTVIKTATTGGGLPDRFQCQDVIGRTIRTATEGFDGTWIYVDQYFDSSGRVERVSEPYYAGAIIDWNETAYDPIGRPDSVLAADSNHMTFNYDSTAINSCTSAGPRVKTTANGLGQVQVEIMNALGETLDVYDNSCGNVTYGYDAIGNLRQVTGADGETVTMSYDLADRKTAMSDPDKGNWQYVYNPLGEMTRQLDAKGQVIDFSYDTLGRLTDRREQNASLVLQNRETTSYQNSTSPFVTGKGQPTSMVYRTGESGEILHQRIFTYDSFGRVDEVITTLESAAFTEQSTYDQFGRLFQQFDASGGSRGIRSHYNARGYLSKLQEAREGTSGTVYQEVISMDARGNATQVKLGNGVDVFANHETSSGRLLKLSAYTTFGVELQGVDYLFDLLGNLKQRHDLSVATNFNETFNYDDLNRLLDVSLSINGAAANQTLAMSYDASGNILTKSDVGTYLYNGAQPHAVSSAGGVSYGYDANGNQIYGNGRTITYTVFDKTDHITKGINETLFSYGIGNSRYQRTDKQGGVTQKTTLYLGATERIDEGGSISFKRYLSGAAVATFYPSTNTQNIDYLLKDHIGSIHTVLNESAQIKATMHFSAFGERQDMNWETPLTQGLYAQLNDITTRGFTGHEQADDVGIIHMNGRIYDAKLGRFLQADPIVQAPKNSQSLNRYSYVLNNPLSYTDPSGFFSLSRFVKKWGKVIIAATASYLTYGAASGWLAGTSLAGSSIAIGAISGGLSGLVGGGIIRGTVSGAFKGALVGSLMGGMAGHFGHTYTLSRIASDSLLGGMGAEIYGGDFKDGLKLAFMVSSLTYLNFKMDMLERANSTINPDNLNKPGSGLFGKRFSLAGARRTVHSDGSYFPCGSPAGGCQGKPIVGNLDQSSNLLGIQYNTEGTVGYIVDTFAGPHDWLRNHISRSYDVLGNSKHFVGFRRIVDQIANGLLIPVAVPFSMASLIGTQPSVYLTALEYISHE